MIKKRIVYTMSAVLVVFILFFYKDTLYQILLSQKGHYLNQASYDVIDEERSSKNNRQYGNTRESENKGENEIGRSKSMSEKLNSFVNIIKGFKTFSKIRTICDFGFERQSAEVLITESTPEVFMVFTDSEDYLFKNQLLNNIKDTFTDTKIDTRHGNIVQLLQEANVSCDLIHVHADIIGSVFTPVIKKLFYIASQSNLLLISGSPASSSTVMNGLEFLKNCNVVNDVKQHLSRNEPIILWFSGSFKPPKSDFYFLNKQFCNPFFQKINGKCVKAELKPCSPTSNECFHNDETGVVSISCEVWRKAQSSERDIWVTSGAASDRNDGHTRSFNNYKDLPKHLGNVLELGSGPFTQSQSILRDRTADSITLVEPMAFQYIRKVRHCFYGNGMFKNIPTTICSMPVEEFHTNVTFDTVIMINVIEHVYDALPLLNAAVKLVKVGGLFIWQDKTWDNLKGLGIPDTASIDFILHPIRMKTPILEQVISVFDKVYASRNASELLKYNHQGIYFIGRKRDLTVHSDLPPRHPCTENLTNGSVVVIFTAPSNITHSMNYITIAENNLYTKAIILVQTSVFKRDSLSKLIRFSKIKAVVSHHHLPRWHQQIQLFSSPCTGILNNLTDMMLQQHSTVCIGE